MYHIPQVLILEQHEAARIKWNAQQYPQYLTGWIVSMSQVQGGPYTKIHNSVVPAAKLEYQTDLLLPGDYYFIVEAMDIYGNLSRKSDEVKVTID